MSVATVWCGLTFTHFCLVISNLLPNFLTTVTHSYFNIMSSVIPLDKNWRKWREKCTGWNLDLASFNGSQRHLLFDRIQKWPCTYTFKKLWLLKKLKNTFWSPLFYLFCIKSTIYFFCCIKIWISAASAAPAWAICFIY